MRYEAEREDNDGYDEIDERVFNVGKFMRRVADESLSPEVREMVNDLREMESMSSPFDLGLYRDIDYRDDLDDLGPF
jgi:hypothetical protein